MGNHKKSKIYPIKSTRTQKVQCANSMIKDMRFKQICKSKTVSNFACDVKIINLEKYSALFYQI